MARYPGFWNKSVVSQQYQVREIGGQSSGGGNINISEACMQSSCLPIRRIGAHRYSCSISFADGKWTVGSFSPTAGTVVRNVAA